MEIQLARARDIIHVMLQIVVHTQVHSIKIVM
jgi:hypothetical protein